MFCPRSCSVHTYGAAAMGTFRASRSGIFPWLVRSVSRSKKQGVRQQQVTMNQNKKRITINDIAQECGVSKTSVSFAFNDPGRLSVQTRENILKTAERLGYFPDPLARNLSLRKHNSIGFLLPQDIGSTLGNPYISLVIQGIATVCQQKGHTLTIIPPFHSSALDAVKLAAVDGLIALGMDVDPGVTDFLNKRKVPFVTIDGKAAPNLPSVNIDDRLAAFQIMKEVLDKGHRRLAIVSLTEDLFTAADAENPLTAPYLRRQGYEEALKQYGLDLATPDVSVLVCECTFQDGRDLVSKLLGLRQKITAVIAMSDIVALGILYGLKEQGIQVPSQLSVVGFDDIPEAALSYPKLTTVSQPGIEKGKLAAMMLFDYLEGKSSEIKQAYIPFELAMRESLGPVAIQSR